MEVSRKWAAVLRKILPEVSVVVTSEPYGELLADSMNIAHVPFDISRTMFPVSASSICAEPIQNWPYLPLAVQQAFSRKVVILGTESTGKTTLSEQLAAHYGGTAVHEAGRDLIPSSLRVTLHDLHSVAIEHARRINTATRAPSPLIIIDTDVHTTMSYSRFLLGEELKVSDQILRSNAADLYLYLGSQVPFVQDGTRLELADRNRLNTSHKTVLREHGILFHEIDDVEWNQRFSKAKQLIDAMLRQAYTTRSA
jgi:HTH-type transcriptional repressor of NAD biosynthesis genes